MSQRARRWGICSGLLAAILVPGMCRAGELTATVLASDGKPLADAVVYALPPAGTPVPAPARRSIMDQLDKAFVPHVLAVQTGTTVDFPNNDTINHHVYSFSPAKTFQLKLFKNDTSKHSVDFDRPGVVTMGCNIHDWMLGYIFVVDTPWFGVSDDRGHVRIDLPDAGTYTLKLWQPRANEDLGKLDRSIVAGHAAQDVQLQLGKPLKPERRTPRAPSDYGG